MCSRLKLYLVVAITLIATGFSKDCLPPSGEWDYLFEGDVAASSATAALDGTLDNNNNSDHWDAKAPGSDNSGGIAVVPVAGEPGNSARPMVDAVATSGTNIKRRFALTHNLAAGDQE
jgi:hypothetical protein